MATATLGDRLLLRPSRAADYRAKSTQRTAGLVIAFVGMVAATVALVNSAVAGNLIGTAGEADTVARLGAWSFGLTSAAVATIKLAIAVILMGILAKLWLRVESVKASLPALRVSSDSSHRTFFGEATTDYGLATVTAVAPKPLLIHKLARVMWGPSLAMGYMAVVAGFILSIYQSQAIGSDPALAHSLSSWTQGIQFLGEGFVLSGISFLLGSILASLRAGGGEVQESLRVPIKTLHMPTTAKLFVGLMMFGLMVEIFQFVVYLNVPNFSDPTKIASYLTWLGPVREAGLGIILAGIALALVTIGNVLGFQFSRIKEIITTGH